MSQEDRDYELKVLKMIMNKYLDKNILLTEKYLESLEANRDEFAWELATKIYSQSGHKVKLSVARDVIISRIETMKPQLQEVRRVAEKKAQLEEACRVAEKKAQLEEARRVEEEARFQMTCLLEEFAGDKEKVCLFFRVRKIVSNNLKVEENEVNLDSRISNYLGNDYLAWCELGLTLEEEFDIDIPVDDVDIIKNLVDYICNKIATPA